MVEENKVKRLLTLPEVAKFLRVSVSTIRHEIKLNKLHAIRIGNQLRVALTDLDAYLKSQGSLTGITRKTEEK